MLGLWVNLDLHPRLRSKGLVHSEGHLHSPTSLHWVPEEMRFWMTLHFGETGRGCWVCHLPLGGKDHRGLHLSGSWAAQLKAGSFRGSSWNVCGLMALRYLLTPIEIVLMFLSTPPSPLFCFSPPFPSCLSSLPPPPHIVWNCNHWLSKVCALAIKSFYWTRLNGAMQRQHRQAALWVWGQPGVYSKFQDSQRLHSETLSQKSNPPILLPRFLVMP